MNLKKIIVLIYILEIILNNVINFRMDSHNQENEKPIILEPDHPLLQKFQITLKKFLEEENERTKIEILELVNVLI